MLGNKIYALAEKVLAFQARLRLGASSFLWKMTDEQWMAMALAEARKGIGKTAPNPPVGALIAKDGKLLGAGWHHGAGLPHAEVEAISSAKHKYGEDCLEGATAYVTLEPCSTVGRTPACTDALVSAKLSHVVYGCEDPHHLHAGAAKDILQKAGISVTSGILTEACEAILRPFSKVQRTGLPWVIWKCAMSLDGRIVRPADEGQWLSGEESRADVQRLRAEVDAIITSGETVRSDKPALTIRVAELLEGRSQPWRVVVTDRQETMPAEAALFSDRWRERTLIRSGADLDLLLRNLVKEQGILSVMIEAGGKFSSAMIAGGFVDEVVIYQAPLLCGATVPALGCALPQSARLEGMTREAIGDDLKIRGLLVI